MSFPDSPVCSSPADLQFFELDDSIIPRPLSRRNSLGESPQRAIQKRASDVALELLNDKREIKRSAPENTSPLELQFVMPTRTASASSKQKNSSASAPPPTPSKQRAVVCKYPISTQSRSDKAESLSPRALENSPAQDFPKPSFSPKCTSPFFLLNQKAVEEGSIEINQQTVHLTPFSEQGSYMRVYTIRAENQVVKGVSNDALVIKIYHGVKNSGFDESVNRAYLQNSMRNYFEAIAKGLAVAPIYNCQTVSADLFILQEKIPHEIDVNNAHQLEQVRKFFQISLMHGLILDLLDTNLRMREDGTVILIDFVEEPKEGFQIFIRHAIRSWGQLFASRNEMNRMKTEKFLNDLTKGFDEYQSMNIEELAEIKKCVLNDIFFVVQMFGTRIALPTNGSI